MYTSTLTPTYHIHPLSNTYTGYDARGCEGQQSPHHPAAPVRGLALLEGQHPLEGPGHARTSGEHDLEVSDKCI